MSTRVLLTERGSILLELPNEVVELPLDAKVPLSRLAKYREAQDAPAGEIGDSVETGDPLEEPATDPGHLAEPDLPKFPPRAMLIVTSSERTRPRTVLGPFDIEETRRWAPFSLRLELLTTIHKSALTARLSSLRAAARKDSKYDTTMLNVFVTTAEMKQGIDIDKIREKVSDPSVGLGGFRLLLISAPDHPESGRTSATR